MSQSKSNEEDKTLDELNGKTVTLGKLIEGINDKIGSNKSKVYVPMYQRNYKWNLLTAEKFVKDLINAYDKKNKKSISLFTLYIDAENNIQVVDGQQRMITLQLMFKALNKLHEFIPLEFERDFSLDNDKRVEFIKNSIDNDFEKSVALSDKRRFKHNYDGIKKILGKAIDDNGFVNYIKENVSLLLHITRDEPVSEFLNLNCNKTKFSICDRVRSALITYPVFNKIEDENEKNKIASMLDSSDYKKGISALFEEITRLLYIEDIYNTVKLGYEYPDKTYENRINIMFCDLLEDPSNSNGYMKCKSIDEVDKIKLLYKLYKLAYYKKMLQELELDNRNYQTHRAFKNFYYHNKVKFFDLIDEYIDKQDKLNLYDILQMEHSIDKHILDYTQQNLNGKDTYFVNSYFEVLSKTNKSEEKEEYSSLLENQFKNNNENKLKYFSLDKDIFEDIVQGSGKYILYRYINERHMQNENMISFPPVISFDDENNDESVNTKDYNENDNNDPLTEITMKDLLEKKIIIPVIQRDYCMGSHFNQNDKSNMLDYIIDNFNKNKDITLSAITVFYSQEKQINIYDGQQRIFTLACLLKFLGYDQTPDITFEHRDSFKESIKKFFESGEINIDSYAAKSIANHKIAFDNKKVNQSDKEKLKNYILEKVKFDVITVSGELSTAEQFFTEINDGVQLVPYEIFKCKINARLEKLFTCENKPNENCSGCDNESFYKQWVSNIDNKWLDYFYKLNNTQSGNEEAVEELMETRFIEFCSRMIYWEKYLNEKLKNKSEKHPLKLKSFEKFGNELGDMDVFINKLTIIDFERISEIMENLIEIGELNYNKDECGECVEYDGKTVKEKYTTNPKFIIPKFKNNCNTLLIKTFLISLQEDNEERPKDIVMWHILNHLKETDKDNQAIVQIIENWNNTIIYDSPFAYVTPSFIGKYENATLPVPRYYYDEKNYMNIYEKLPIKDKVKEDKLFEIYDGILNNNSVNQTKTTNNKSSEYQIFYKYATSAYNNNEFRDTGYKGKIITLKNNKGCLIEYQPYKYKYLNKAIGNNFYRDIYDTRLKANEPGNIYVEGLVFDAPGDPPYYVEIESKHSIK